MEISLATMLAPSLSMGIVIGLLVIAVVLFASEVLSVDIITFILLLVLIAAGILTPQQAFEGFSSEIIIVLGSIFVLCGALQETGVVDAAGRVLVKIAGQNETVILLVLMVVAATVSAFVNNTTVTAMFVGPAVGLARRAKISPSRLLLPLAFASILGGTCTLIGTSTNVAVSGYMSKSHLKPLTLFELAPIGIVIVGVGVAYMLTIGRWLLPNKKDVSLLDDTTVRDYLSEIIILPGSHLIQQRIFRSDLSRMGFRVLRVRRGGEMFVPGYPARFEEGDIVLVTGGLQSLVRVKSSEGIEIKADWKLGDLKMPDKSMNIVEALVTPQSVVVGRTLKETNYHQQFGVTVLGIFRSGRNLVEKIGSIPLEVGDLLVVQGEKDRLAALQEQRQLAVLSELPIAALRKYRGLIAVAVFGGAMLLNMLEIAPLGPVMLAAAVLSVLFRCISIDRAYQLMDWRLLILIGGMTAFGTAVDITNADEFLAYWIVWGLESFGVTAVLAGFFVVTILLTQPMSNAAAALVVLPVALQAARDLGVNERTFGIAIMLAASVSFITPFEPASVLVYGPGRYRFADFLKTGGLLTLILAPVVLFLLPRFWPLH